MKALRATGVRLAVTNGVVLLAAITGFAALAFLAVDRALLQGADRVLSDELDEAARDLLARPWTAGELALHLRAEAQEERIYQISYRLRNPNGEPIVRAGPATWEAIPPAPAASVEPLFRTLRLPGDEHRHRVASRRVEGTSLGPVDVEVALRLRPEDEAIERLLDRATLAGPLAVLVATAVGLFLAGRALRPVGVLDRAARAIGADSRGARLPRTGTGDELDRLAETLNGMLERLEAATARNIAFAGDVAHELRTPLATVRARLEEALGAAAPARRSIETALEEVGRVEALVANLLLLARADEGGASLRQGRTDLAALAREVGEFFGPLAQAADVRLSVEAPVAAPVAGDPALLRRAIANLVDNAIRHGGAGAEVRIAVRVGRDAVAVEVADTGRGIDAALGGRVFERFFRVPHGAHRQADGSGLGLAIVRAIARGHGGEATYTPGRGGGSVFRIEIPSHK